MSQNHTIDNKARPQAHGRVVWFDYAKGICIILVVMMHSTLGVGEAFAEKGWGAQGFMHLVVAYAKPFRMPDFFLLSGLFLSLAIGRGWLHYLDKKLVHFAYFYVLWLLIQMPLRMAAEGGLTAATFGGQLVDALVNPYAPLWFIYVLPLMFIATKLLRWVPAVVMLAGAALMHGLEVKTGWGAIDDYLAHYYVFFLAGYLLAPVVFAVAAWSRRNTSKSLLVIAAWAIANGVLAFSPAPGPQSSTLAELPVLSLMLGGAGAVAVVMAASVLSKFEIARFIAYCGKNSIVLYVSFMIPMAVTRIAIVKTGVVTDTGAASLIVWLVALVSPLVVHAVLRVTPLRFLYERPTWLKLPYRQPTAPACPPARIRGALGLPAS